MSNLEELEDEIIALKEKIRLFSREVYHLPDNQRRFMFQIYFHRFIQDEYYKIYNNPIYQKKYTPLCLKWEIEDTFEHERELILEYGFFESILI